MIRFEQFSRHLDVLKRAHQEDLQNEFIISGIIDKFFIQFELGWKVLKELVEHILSCYIAEFERMRNAVKEQYGSLVIKKE